MLCTFKKFFRLLQNTGKYLSIHTLLHYCLKVNYMSSQQSQAVLSRSVLSLTTTVSTLSYYQQSLYDIHWKHYLIVVTVRLILMILTGNLSLIFEMRPCSCTLLSSVKPGGINSACNADFLALHRASHFLTCNCRR